MGAGDGWCAIDVMVCVVALMAVMSADALEVEVDDRAPRDDWPAPRWSPLPLLTLYAPPESPDARLGRVCQLWDRGRVDAAASLCDTALAGPDTSPETRVIASLAKGWALVHGRHDLVLGGRGVDARL